MYVKDLYYQYKKSSEMVLNGVSFTIQKNKLNVVVGANGAGKTTLFDCMTGILPVERGEMALPPPSAILYQTQSLYFSAAIRTKDFVNFVRRINNQRGIKNQQQLADAFQQQDEEQLQKLWHRKLGSLSIGERKWIFMMTLSQLDRSLFIFDEPMSGVDPSARLKIARRIDALIKGGKTCMLSTHQLHDLQAMDCHLIVLGDHVVKYEGNYKEWLASHNTDNPDIAFELTCHTATS